MVLVELGENRLVVDTFDDEYAVGVLVDYFGLPSVDGQNEAGDWVLEDGSIVSVCISDEFLIV